MKTVITITVEHEKPLPDDLLDLATERVWNRCAAKGMMCEVNGEIEKMETIDLGTSWMESYPFSTFDLMFKR